MDDILVGASSMSLLVRRINFVLDVCRKTNVKLSPKKFKLGKEVVFGGYRISHDVVNDLVLIQPSVEKVEAIQNI